MMASLGGSLLVIVLFFLSLATMLVLAVEMEASLQRPRSRHRLAQVPVRVQGDPGVAVDPTDSPRVA